MKTTGTQPYGTIIPRDQRLWALRAACGNLRKALWYASDDGRNARQAMQLAMDAQLFLGIAVQAGASTQGYAWRWLDQRARAIATGLLH